MTENSRSQHRIYIASSSRNRRLTELTKSLREKGHTVFNFTEEDQPAAWAQLNSNGQGNHGRSIDFDQVIEMLEDQDSVKTFERDMTALKEATAVICVLPCSRSAHLELGYAIATGKRTVILYEDPEEPDLMHRAAAYLVRTIEGVHQALEDWAGENLDPTGPPRYIKC